MLVLRTLFDILILVRYTILPDLAAGKGLSLSSCVILFVLVLPLLVIGGLRLLVLLIALVCPSTFLGLSGPGYLGPDYLRLDH